MQRLFTVVAQPLPTCALLMVALVAFSASIIVGYTATYARVVAVQVTCHAGSNKTRQNELPICKLGPKTSYFNKLLIRIQDLFLIILSSKVYILYKFQAGFPLANAPVPFWLCKNLVAALDICSSHSTLFHEHILLCIITPNTNYQYTKYFPI